MSIGKGAPAWPSVIVSNGQISRSEHTEVAERVCKHTRTHYGFCSLALANPALDERQSRSDAVVSYTFDGPPIS